MPAPAARRPGAAAPPSAAPWPGSAALWPGSAVLWPGSAAPAVAAWRRRLAPSRYNPTAPCAGSCSVADRRRVPQWAQTTAGPNDNGSRRQRAHLALRHNANAEMTGLMKSLAQLYYVQNTLLDVRSFYRRDVYGKIYSRIQSLPLPVINLVPI